jgi:AAHS family 4-hydroxybenzoate transporter-like MFS transporter
MPGSTSVNPAVNITDLIDSNPIRGFQIGIFVLCALVALLDGVDTQSIGVAAPFIAENLGIPVTSFGPIFSSALLGAMLGALTFGPLADRFGRKVMLIIATLVFAIFTLATPFSDSVGTLMACRLLAGIGLGGATPCFIALTSEYTPVSKRAMVVTAQWAAFPLGGMLGGLLNSYVVATFGWRAIFYIGGIAPLVLSVLLAWLLPESLRFLLAKRSGATAQVGRITAALFGKALPAGVQITSSEEKLGGLSVKHLFMENRGLTTVLLWVPFFIGFGILAVVTLWTPALLRQHGISASSTAFVIAFNGLGAIFGQGFAGRLLSQFGPVRTLVPAFIAGAACTAALGYATTSVAGSATFVGLVGLFLGMGTGGAIALAAMAYPTAIRSTGVGWAMGMGRFGQTLYPLASGSMLGWGWGTDGMLNTIGGSGLIAALFVVLLHLRMQQIQRLHLPATAAAT